MSSSDYEPFTYLIGWSKLNKFYYGVRYGRRVHPKTLWISYFTSSIEVDRFRLSHGEPDIKQIRRIFKTEQDARTWETRVLKRIDAAARKDFST